MATTPEQISQEPIGQTTPALAVGSDESADAKLVRLEKELKEARSEAARYRTTLRSQEQAQQEADAAKLAEQGEYKKLLEKEQTERARLAAELAKREHEAAQRKAATDAGIDSDVWASRLVGATPEELATDAAALAKSLKPSGAPALGATNPSTARTTGHTTTTDPKNLPTLHSIQWKT